MSLLANSEDPDEMWHNGAFHPGLKCLVRQNDLQRKKYIFYLEIITCDPSIYTMDHSKFIVSNQKDESIFVLMVKDVVQYIFVYFYALHTSQQFFSHVGTIWLN